MNKHDPGLWPMSKGENVKTNKSFSDLIKMIKEIENHPDIASVTIVFADDLNNYFYRRHQLPLGHNDNE